eukprot:1346766-Amorphochlora_amoeboformis.AAC.1
MDKGIYGGAKGLKERRASRDLQRSEIRILLVPPGLWSFYGDSLRIAGIPFVPVEPVTGFQGELTSARTLVGATGREMRGDSRDSKGKKGRTQGIVCGGRVRFWMWKAMFGVGVASGCFSSPCVHLAAECEGRSTESQYGESRFIFFERVDTDILFNFWCLNLPIAVLFPYNTPYRQSTITEEMQLRWYEAENK